MSNHKFVPILKSFVEIMADNFHWGDEFGVDADNTGEEYSGNKVSVWDSHYIFIIIYYDFNGFLNFMVRIRIF